MSNRGYATHGYSKPILAIAEVSPTTVELHWAAGFLDGEGCFSSKSTTQHVSAQQTDPELLFKLSRLFGGNVRRTYKKYPMPEDRRIIHQWHIYGTRARGVMLTLYSLLSEKRQLEIEAALKVTSGLQSS